MISPVTRARLAGFGLLYICPTCRNSLSSGDVVRCSICLTSYCSENCREEHWPIHLLVCRPLPLPDDSPRFSRTRSTKPNSVRSAIEFFRPKDHIRIMLKGEGSSENFTGVLHEEYTLERLRARLMGCCSQERITSVEKNSFIVVSLGSHEDDYKRAFVVDVLDDAVRVILMDSAEKKTFDLSTTAMFKLDDELKRFKSCGVVLKTSKPCPPSQFQGLHNLIGQIIRTSIKNERSDYLEIEEVSGIILRVHTWEVLLEPLSEEYRKDRQTRKFNMLTNLAPLGENDTEPKKDFGAHNLSIDCVDNRRQLQSGKQDSSKDKEFHNRSNPNAKTERLEKSNLQSKQELMEQPYKAPAPSVKCNGASSGPEVNQNGESEDFTEVNFDTREVLRQWSNYAGSEMKVTFLRQDPLDIYGLMSSNFDQLLGIISDLDHYSSNSDFSKLVTPKVSNFCFARTNEGEWNRAAIMGVEKEKIRVFFTEKAYEELVDRECLRKIPTRLARLPVLPVRFIIDGETDLKKVLPLELHDKINVLRIDEGRKGIVVSLTGVRKLPEQGFDWSDALKLLDLPLGHETTLIPLDVSSPSCLYVTLPKGLNLVTDVSEQLNQAGANMEKFIPKKNQPCAAKCSDGDWYRCLCLEREEKVAKIHSLDFGFEESVAIDNIKKIPEDLLPYGFPVFRCAVEGFEGVQISESLLEIWKKIQPPQNKESKFTLLHLTKDNSKVIVTISGLSETDEFLLNMLKEKVTGQNQCGD